MKIITFLLAILLVSCNTNYRSPIHYQSVVVSIDNYKGDDMCFISCNYPINGCVGHEGIIVPRGFYQIGDTVKFTK